jgi:putative transposase
MRRIDELHLKHPFFGSRRLVQMLKRKGTDVGRQHVATVMRLMGIEAIYRKKRTTIPEQGHRIYPYLLRDVAMERPNQVWASDLTYLPMAKGFAYLVAIVDLYSRKVLAWRVSNALTSEFCVEALEEALARYGAPEIFNTDQGSQFTRRGFHHPAAGQERARKYGRQGALGRQRVRRAAVARRHLPARLRDAARGDDRAVALLPFLQ